jgi:hypothetical protein
MIIFFAFTYPKSKRVCKVLPKIDIFHGICKKTKIVISNALFLAPNFDFFYTPRDTSICCCETTLWACNTGRSMCKFLVSVFLTFWNIYQIIISKQWEHMLPGAKTPYPLLFIFFGQFFSLSKLRIQSK